MDITVYEVALIPLVTGLVQLSKQLGFPKKYGSLLSLVLGLIAGIVFVYPSDIKGGIITGLMIGLSASGLYSGVKNAGEGNSKK